MPISTWLKPAEDGYPIVVANLYKDKKSKKPLFKEYILKKAQGNKMGIIGFLTESAWKGHTDTTLAFKSPFEYKKLIHKVDKKTDFITVIGEFNKIEADSFLKTFPEVNLLITSAADNGGATSKQGNAMIMGQAQRGYYGSYIDFNPMSKDTNNYFLPNTLALDGMHGEDSTVQKIIVNANKLAQQNKNP